MTLATSLPPAPAAEGAVGSLYDDFVTDTVASGAWDLSARDGTYTWTGTGAKLSLSTVSTSRALGIERPLTITAPELTIEAVVIPHVKYRFGVILWDGLDRVQIEVDDWAYCVCYHNLSDGAWNIQHIGVGGPTVGVPTIVRMTLRDDHTVTGEANGATVTSGNVRVRPQNIDKIELRVWRGYSGANASSYTVDSIRVSSPGVPGAPQGLDAWTGSDAGEIRLAWSSPADDGGAAISAFRVYGARAGDPLAHVADVLGYSFDHEGLGPGETWTYRVSAVNVVGEGALSPAASATTLTLPEAPGGAALAATGPGELTLTWLAPATTSTISAYRVYAGDDAATLALVGQVGGAARSFTETGLDPGARVLAVSAVNRAGEGPRSLVASGVAYAEYAVEMRAWIPHATVVDPLLPEEETYAIAYARSVGACDEDASFFSRVNGWFEGDDHTDFTGRFRVRTMIHFRWDGSAMSAVDTRPLEPHFGTTFQMRQYRDPDGSTEECVLRAATVDEAWSGAGSGTSFRIDYASPNPIIRVSPTIDGWLDGAFDASGDLVLTYQTDQFPSHGFRVTRNGVLQVTSLPTDASCLTDADVHGTAGSDRLKRGLESTQDVGTLRIAPGDAGLVAGVPSKLCA